MVRLAKVGFGLDRHGHRPRETSDGGERVSDGLLPTERRWDKEGKGQARLGVAGLGEARRGQDW